MLKQKKVTSQLNGEVSEISQHEKGLGFKLKEFALPFPQEVSIEKGLGLIPFEKDLNQQVLLIQNLETRQL